MLYKNVFGIVLLLPSLAFSQVKLFDNPLSPRIANYSLKAKLLPESKAVEASYDLNWWNASNDTVLDLQFHLYLNGFKNEKSTFLRERSSRSRTGGFGKNKENWGYVDVKSFQINGEDVIHRIEYIDPDDDNVDDQTVMRIVLSKPILPNQSIRIHCDFFSKLPRVADRTGFTEDNFYLVGQWFPKIGVWRDHRWNCHQFHSNTEFFADFGVYDMEISAPSQYIVGANAVLVKKQESDSVNVYTYHQEDVIDAVWTASPHFKEVKHKVKINSTGKEVDVTYLLSPGREEMTERYFKCVDAMFNYYNNWYGEYPYPNLTIVDPPLGEEFTAGGMEYPTLVTTGSFMGSAFAEKWIGLHWLEVVTFHEFGHNYFQSLVATNEFEEAWLDEGFTSFAEHRALEEYFKDTPASFAFVFGLPVSSADYHRISYLSRPRDGIISQTTWKQRSAFIQTGEYSKPTLVLATLQNYLGDSLFNKVMRTYFERWKFRHPQGKDFIALVNEVSNKDLGWFFDQFVHSPKTVDYQVVAVRNIEINETVGWFGPDDQKKFVEDSENEKETRYHSVVTVRNNGDAYFPTSILVKFANGDFSVDYWDGKESIKEFSYDRNSKIISATVDPTHINLLDLNLANNTRIVDPENAGIARYSVRVLFWMQTLLQNLTMFI